MSKNQKTASNASHATVIGRMEPPHAGHIGLIRHGLAKASRVLVILGSCSGPRTPVNPFSLAERKQMIEANLTVEEISRLHVVGVRDRYDLPLWIGDVQALIRAELVATGCQGPTRLVGHFKDASISYLAALAQIEDCVLDEVPSLHGGLNATDIRLAMFDSNGDFSMSMVLDGAISASQGEWLKAWIQTETGQWVRNYHLGVVEYQRRWGKGPFYTADAVIRCNGHVLVVERGGDPTQPHIGAGTLASPGGFRNPNETPLENALRETDEETQIVSLGDVTMEELVRGFVRSQEFGHPSRSPRAHIITTNHLIHLDPRPNLPRLQGSDDVRSAKWEPEGFIEHLDDRMFEDHGHMFRTMLAPLHS